MNWVRSFAFVLLSGRKLGLWFAAFVVFAALSSVWAVASPLSSTPDEPAHVIKAAAVVRGEPIAQRTMDSEGRTVWTYQVDEVYAELDHLTCNAFRPQIPISQCSINLDDNDPPVSEKITAAGGYNPLYYYLVGWPSLFISQLKGILAMRLVSGILASAFLALAVWAVSWIKNPGVPLLATFFTVSPAVIFYSGSVNPQGLEVATLAAFATAYFVVLTRRPRGPLLTSMAVIMLVAGAIGVNVRALSWVWLGAIVLIGMIWVGFRRWWRTMIRPKVLIAAMGVIIAIVLNLLLVFSVGTLDGANYYWGAGISAVNGFFFMLWRFPDFVPSMFGLYGWMDIQVRWVDYIYVAMTSMLVGATLISRLIPRHRWAILVTLLFWWTLPAAVQASSVTEFGFVWQGRYALPLWVLLMLVTSIALSSRIQKMDEVTHNRVFATVATLLAFAHVVALVGTLHRQYFGIDRPLSLLLNFKSPWVLDQHLPIGIGTGGWILVMILVASTLGLFAYSVSLRAGVVATKSQEATSLLRVPERVDD